MSQTEQVRILRIVVASPGDVQAERNCVQAVADELNRSVPRERPVRAMPNTPCLIRQGMTAVAAGAHATPEVRAALRAKQPVESQNP